MKKDRRVRTEEQFKEEVALKFKNSIKIVGRFKSIRSPILIEDKYGIRKIPRAEQLIYGYYTFKVPFISNALNKTEYFMRILEEKHPKLAKKLIPYSEYVKSTEKMLFKTKYGIVSVTPGTLMDRGVFPSHLAAINRLEYTKAQANEVHNNFYKYDKVKTSKRKSTKVVITCPIHGDFTQGWDNHINKKCGCPKCSIINNLSKSYLKTHKGDGFYMYIVKFTSYDNMESFWKVGYTGYGNLGRFEKIPYSIESVNFYRFESCEKALTEEQKAHSILSDIKYKPKMFFNGFSECYNEDPLHYLNVSNYKLYDIV